MSDPPMAASSKASQESAAIYLYNYNIIVVLLIYVWYALGEQWLNVTFIERGVQTTYATEKK